MTRVGLTRKLKALNTKRWQARLALPGLREVVRQAEASLGSMDSEALKLEAELITLIGPPPTPTVTPTCWCCSCANQSVRHEGCRACWVRTDVQRWIDAVGGVPARNQMTADHGTGFSCPAPGRSQCPGWEPRKGED